MKKTAKILALVLSVVVSISVLAGCGGSKQAREKGSYTYWVTLPTEVSQSLGKFDDMLMYQELEKRTGIHVDFIHPTNGSKGDEAFKVLLASNDLPDMVEYKWTSYPGGADKAIADRVIIRLNEYMQEYAPNYYAYMEGDKAKENNNLYKVQTITAEGNYYGFKSLNMGSYRTFGGLIVRKDLLDKWGVEIPVTIDDWTNLFKIAKDKGIKYPLTGDEGMFTIRGGAELFNSAWNVGKIWYVDNGEVKYGPEQPAYKDYIKQMAEWYKAGYIHPDYLTNDETTIQGDMTNGTSIVTYGAIGAGMGKLLSAMESRDPDYNLAACPYPVLKEGDAPYIHDVDNESVQPTIAITYMCGAKDEERYKEAMKWCDYLYSDEGIILKEFGVKGVTYNEVTKEDGSKGYEYIISKPEEMKKINVNSVQAALYHFMRPANSPGFNQHPDYLNGYYPFQQQKDAMKLWSTYVEDAKKHTLPTLSYKDEETARRKEINTLCRDGLDAAISDIICNRAGIDTYDAAVKKAMDEGFTEYKKITQTAYNRYLDNLK